MKPAFSIVIPAYNEAGRLPRNIPLVAAYCESLRLSVAGAGTGRGAGRDDSEADEPLPCEVLVMVERSTDGTLEKAREAAAPFPAIEIIDNEVQRGKGYAVRQGMLRAAGEIVLFMDADLSTPLSEIGRFLDYFATHPRDDVLIGNRRHPSSRIGRAQGRVRRSLSRMFNGLVMRSGMLPGGSWADTQCGFKAFRQEAAREIFARQKLDGFSFDVEVLALAQALGLRVADLPVEWFDADATRVRLWRDGWKMLRDLRRVRVLVGHSMREQPRARD